MSRPAATARRAAAALDIRRAAAPLVLHGVVDAAAWTRAVAAEAEAWHLFLRLDRCALLLQRALDPGPEVATEVCVRGLIEQAARREAARVLTVRTQLREIAEVAASGIFRVAVLKGGVHAAGDSAVDLGDLDVLVPPDEVAGFAAALESIGWRATGGSSPEVRRSLEAHRVTLEIHERLESGSDRLASAWERTEPLAALPSLRQLGPGDNLLHVVRHVALTHPHRRTRLRDLWLISRSARRCSALEVASAFEGLEDYAGRISRATLDAALRLCRDPDEEGDRRALIGYVLAQRHPLPLVPRTVNEFVDLWAFSMLQGPWERRQIWAGARLRSLTGSSRAYIRAIERRSERLGRIGRVTARTAYRAATWIVARPIAARARRVIDAATPPRLAAQPSSID